MKHLLSLNLRMAAVAAFLLACGVSCRHAEPVAESGEIIEVEESIPAESAIFRISGGKLIVNESAISWIWTSLRGDTLEVYPYTDVKGTLKREVVIPTKAKKIRLWDSDFDLPRPDHTAYFYSFFAPGYSSGIVRAERGVIQGMMLLLSFAPDRKTFDVQIRYLCCSEFEKWQKKDNSSFMVADDGQILQWLGRPDWPGLAPVHYWLTETFKNRGGHLQLHLLASGRFFDCSMEKKCILREIDLPLPDPIPGSVFFVNMPPRVKYMEENLSRAFEVKKSVAEFRDFAGKLKLLRFGMTPEETAAILGKPDEYRMYDAISPKSKAHAFASYYFLKGRPDSVDDLKVTLSFQQDPSGVFRLEWVF